jgi:phosphoribosylanthranilate isomerase
MPRVKICGIKRPEDLQAVIASDADAVGLNFVKKSPRFIGDATAARALMQSAATSSAPHRLLWCGVFVNSKLDEICALAETLKLDVVQLHGEESPDFAAAVKQRLGVTVWKAVRVASADDLTALSSFACDGWVLDSKVDGVHGGSGKTFDWSLLNGLKRKTQLILSGGLHPGNVADAVKRIAPDWVDVASGVESKPGLKDARLVTEFVKAARGS